MPSPVSLLSAEVKAVADRLRLAPVGETVTFPELSAEIGSDIRQRRYILASALRKLAPEGVLFTSVRTVGYQRLQNKEADSLLGTWRKRVRRTGKRLIRGVSACVAKANDLSDEERRKAYSELSVAGLITHLASERTVAKMPEADKPQPVAVTMRQMLEQI